MAGSSGGGGGGGSGGGGIRGGSSGSAYSGGGISGGGGGGSAYEKWLQQQRAAAVTAATQAAQPGAPPPAPGTPEPPATAYPGAPAVPTASITPPAAPVVSVAAPAVPIAPPPLPSSTPAIPVTPAAPAPNALTREGAFQAHVDKAAQNYRDLAARNASPAEKAIAKQDYANALNEKAVATRAERAGLGNTRPMQETGAMTASQAFGMPQRVESPAEQARIAHYNEYLLNRKGIDPYSIGNAQLTQLAGGKHGLAVLSPEQESAARSAVNEAAKRSRDMMNAERVLRRSKTPEGILASQEQRQKRIQFDTEQGFRNPMNPTAGMDTTNAMRVQAAKELLKDSGTLRGVAEARAEAAKAREPAAEGIQESKAKLDLSAQEFRAQQERDAEELRKRRAEIMRQYYS